MNQSLQAARFAAWSAAAAAVAFFAVRALLIDLFPYHSGNSRLAAAVVAGAAAAILAFPKGSVGRALLALGSLMFVTFCISYDALDLLLEPVLEADWPIAVLAVLAGLWIGPVFAIFMFHKK